MCLFAKEVIGLNRSGGSNPPVSAYCTSLPSGRAGTSYLWVREDSNAGTMLAQPKCEEGSSHLPFGEMAEWLKAAVY